MSQYDDSGLKSFPAGAAMAANLRVKLVAGVLQLAGVADKDIGTLVEATFANANFASGFTDATVRLRSKQGTCKCVAASAIAAGADVSTAAAGKVNDTAATGSFLFGTALEAAAADDDTIEVLRIGHGDSAAA